VDDHDPNDNRPIDRAQVVGPRVGGDRLARFLDELGGLLLLGAVREEVVDVLDDEVALTAKQLA
jgi:hypothetical protein